MDPSFFSSTLLYPSVLFQHPSDSVVTEKNIEGSWPTPFWTIHVPLGTGPYRSTCKDQYNDMTLNSDALWTGRSRYKEGVNLGDPVKRWNLDFFDSDPLRKTERVLLMSLIPLGVRGVQWCVRRERRSNVDRGWKYIFGCSFFCWVHDPLKRNSVDFYSRNSVPVLLHPNVC